MRDTKTKTRKLINIGGSYGVTIPKKFIDKAGLKFGDRVGLTYNSILVIVVPMGPKEGNHDNNVI